MRSSARTISVRPLYKPNFLAPFRMLDIAPATIPFDLVARFWERFDAVDFFADFFAFLAIPYLAVCGLSSLARFARPARVQFSFNHRSAARRGSFEPLRPLLHRNGFAPPRTLARGLSAEGRVRPHSEEPMAPNPIRQKARRIFVLYGAASLDPALQYLRRRPSCRFRLGCVVAAIILV
jgi:hypothetical protein